MGLLFRAWRGSTLGVHGSKFRGSGGFRAFRVQGVGREQA